MAFVHNISDRKNIKTKLEKSRLFHEKIIDSVADPLLVKDSNHRYVLVNDAFCSFIKRERSELHGKTDYDLFPRQEADLFQEIDRIVLNQGIEHVNEETVTDTDGASHIFVAKKTLYIDEHDDKFIVCILRDITDQKIAEERLNEKRKSLTAMAIGLSLAEERERIRIASELHDQIGQNLILARIKFAMLEHVQDSSEYSHARSIVSDLLDKVIQNIRSMTVQISPPLLVAAGLEAAVECLARQIQTDYSLKVDFIDDQSEKTLTDELRSVVYQIARELLINVAKHANSDFAKLSIGRDGDMFLLCVEDCGKGFSIDEHVLNSSENCSFGLFNIQQRVECLGGSMTVQSAHNKGTKVTVQIPLSLEQSVVSLCCK